MNKEIPTSDFLAERLPKRQKRILKFKNLTDKQKSLLTAASIGIGGIALGAVGMTLMGRPSKPNKHDENKPTPKPPTDQEGDKDVVIPVFSDAPFAASVTDAMTFETAFFTARQEVGVGGFFEWKGQTYSTYYKEEWDVMTDENKQDFFASIDHNYIKNEVTSEEEITNLLNDREIEVIGDLEEEDIFFKEADNLDEIVIVDPDDGVNNEKNLEESVDEFIKDINGDDL